MITTGKPLYFGHISDTHLGPEAPKPHTADSRPGFNFVQLLPSGEMIILNHTFPRLVS